ncbi:class I SAM-dependent RNA methyltransferase [Pseudorhodoferax sp. Leaf265]|uniref:THUMP domain-containing class I SAM-dependent RNA methyltransferase n=1 Tax=Pseudorhodoferax sp. Leaf265 TaxID=1736315 RepID=UPI0006FE9C65|nr:THUMP domain-containing protein [Pseudorhodoferax sp. Leaf265]KQP20759.1 RNA methyltransferase [Pseudorhodoferax sp. Leaf265]
MQNLRLFLPCAAGVEAMLADEAARIAAAPVQARRAGVRLSASWRDAMRLNLHSRLCQRVLIELAHGDYRQEQDLYAIAANVAWEAWFTPRQSFKIELTAQHSPLKSLNFAALRIKDAIADRFRDKTGSRPDVDTRFPQVRIYAHLTTDRLQLYIDSSGEPLFKRGWREDKGDAPLKETLAAAMLAASGWDAQTPLYDPCCGSGTIAIEAAQIACGIAPGLHRRFGFERLAPFQAHVWAALREEAQAAQHAPTTTVFGSDVAHRMVDFAQRNAQRAGVAAAVQLRGGDALQRMPPAEAGTMLLNPPYGERIAVAGVAGNRLGQPQRGGRETAQTDDGGDFFPQLATHWKRNYAGWTAWVLTPDAKLPSRMRLKESRRVPMWNGPIECRLFRFELVAGSARGAPAAAAPPAAEGHDAS